jgi:hypothetical protein
MIIKINKQIKNLRNDIAYTVINFFIVVVASPEYRGFLNTVYSMGLKEFDREFWERYEEKVQERVLNHRDN